MSDYIEVDGLKVGPYMWVALKMENDELRQQLEQAEARCAELEDAERKLEELCAFHYGGGVKGYKIGEAWVLRKQADAVEFAVSEARAHLTECAWPQSGIPDDAEHALEEIEGAADRLRQQADEAEAKHD